MRQHPPEAKATQERKTQSTDIARKPVDDILSRAADILSRARTESSAGESEMIDCSRVPSIDLDYTSQTPMPTMPIRREQ